MLGTPSWTPLQELITHNAESTLPTSELSALKGTGHLPVYTKSSCDLLHPGQSCSAHFQSIVPAAYLKALPVYFPVYLIPAILVHREKLLTRPLALWPRLLLGSLRSSAFLALYIGFVFAGMYQTVEPA